MSTPGWHKYSVAYISNGQRRYNQPFGGTGYGPAFVQGDVVGVAYRPRTGTVFFTRNGRKLDDVAHGLKTQNLFPTVGADGPCTVHVNFGQLGFVFIEANVKKWGLAPMTGSLAPPPPYGSEQGSILLETGRDGTAAGGGGVGGGSAGATGHYRSRSGVVRAAPPTSPGPVRSPTDISLAQLEHVSSHHDVGEGTSRVSPEAPRGLGIADDDDENVPPPEYTSPGTSDAGSTYRSGRRPDRGRRRSSDSDQPPVPSYDSVVSGEADRGPPNEQRP